MSVRLAVPVVVHVAAVSDPRWRIDDLLGMLDRAERVRAEAARDATDRRRYIVAHALMRLAVAARIERVPAAVRFTRDRTGRPWVADAGVSTRVSLAHAGDVVAVALADGIDVGLDVEPIDPGRADRSTVARYLSPLDLARIDALAPPGRPRALATAWTRLEAEAKGRGVALDGLRGRSRTGLVHDIDVGPMHVATLWTEAPPAAILVDRALLASVA